MAFTFSKVDKDYRNNILKLIEIVYEIVLKYFIDNSPKNLLESFLKDAQPINHQDMIDASVKLLYKKLSKYDLEKFKNTPEHIITQLYYKFFGHEGTHMDEFVFSKKGKGWCERYFPPSDTEMITFIIDTITQETKIQFYNPMIL